jgi:hypothetical protein
MMSCRVQIDTDTPPFTKERRHCCGRRLLRHLVLSRLKVSALGLAEALAGLSNLQVHIVNDFL